MTLPMELRRCANPRCRRAFPIESCSPQVFCDDDCREDFASQIEVTPTPRPASLTDTDAWAHPTDTTPPRRTTR